MKSRRRYQNDLARRNWHKFISNKLAIAGAVIILIILCASMFAHLLQAMIQHIPIHQSGYCRRPPSISSVRITSAAIYFPVTVWRQILNSDRSNRSNRLRVFRRCFGMYFGILRRENRWRDTIHIRTFYVVPQIILILILVAFSGRGIMNLIMIFSITGWTHAHRIVRSKMLSLKQESFVESCVANGIRGGQSCSGIYCRTRWARWWLR